MIIMIYYRVKGKASLETAPTEIRQPFECLIFIQIILNNGVAKTRKIDYLSIITKSNLLFEENKH